MFGLEYNTSIIAQLRDYQRIEAEKHIVKYDPRDIREVYLWIKSLGQYYNIPLKGMYYSQLQINPDDPSDYPLSLKELQLIKKNMDNNSQISQYELNKSLEARQQLVQEARKKTKTAKKARKIQEIKKVHKSKATSTEIRRNDNYEESELFDGFDDEDIEAYPTEWEEVKKEMNIIYIEEKEGDI